MTFQITSQLIVNILIILFGAGFLFELYRQNKRIKKIEDYCLETSKSFVEVGILFRSILQTLPDETMKSVNEKYFKNIEETKTQLAANLAASEVAGPVGREVGP